MPPSTAVALRTPHLDALAQQATNRSAATCQAASLQALAPSKHGDAEEGDSHRAKHWNRACLGSTCGMGPQPQTVEAGRAATASKANPAGRRHVQC